MEVYNDNNNGGPRRLYRSNNKMLAGVCAGVAEYLNIDPTVTRVLAVVLFFTPFIPMLLTYLFVCLVVPNRPQ
ncbi:MAG: PspC domain-containing protein [Tidjanibacter sp.]|nr:PspC domain-containing protein [Tidjanibacter sp.]MBQ6604938.1 PspC domain-containing protein [Tidjanibacter sp.]